MRKVLAATLGVVSLGALAWWLTRTPVVEHEVVAGDTLSKLAATYGVTVDELRDWNGLSGDLIVVGQVLVVGHGAAEEAATTVASPKPHRRSSGSSTGSEGSLSTLRMPQPEACIPFDPDLGDQDIVAPDGLSVDAIRVALDRVLPQALERCDGPPGDFAYRYTVSVGCDGVVDSVSGGGDELGACIADVLRYADFPAHDIADGMSFDYPVSGSL